jgi:hypothetical protein
VRALYRPLFSGSAWPHPAILVLALQLKKLVWPLFPPSAWAQPVTVEAGTKCEGAAIASVCSVGVGTASHCGGGHVKRWRCFSICSLGRRGLTNPLFWWARLLRALLWPLFAVSAWALPATVEACTTGEDDALASVRSVGVGPAYHCRGVHDKRARCSGICSFGRRGLCQLLWWRERQVKALIRPLLARSSWVLPATVVAGTTFEGADLASARWVGVSSASHCVGGHVRCGRCSGLCSLCLPGPSQPLWWRELRVRALLWLLFARSVWAQTSTVVAGTTVEGALLALFAC